MYRITRFKRVCKARRILRSTAYQLHRTVFCCHSERPFLQFVLHAQTAFELTCIAIQLGTELVIRSDVKECLSISVCQDGSPSHAIGCIGAELLASLQFLAHASRCNFTVFMQFEIARPGLQSSEWNSLWLVTVAYCLNIATISRTLDVTSQTYSSKTEQESSFVEPPIASRK